MNNLINLAMHIPTPEAALTVAYTPIRLSMHGRQPLELRLTAPATGAKLPIVTTSRSPAAMLRSVGSLTPWIFTTFPPTKGV